MPDDWQDTPLVGAWTDVYTGLTITTSNPTGSSLTVDVVYGTGPCTASNPTVAISPPNPSAKLGQDVNFTVTVTNNDTTPCSGRAFGITSSQPSRWATTFSSTQSTIAAGSSASFTMTKTVPANAAYANYTIDATEASGTSTGSGVANVTVKPGK